MQVVTSIEAARAAAMQAEGQGRAKYTFTAQSSVELSIRKVNTQCQQEVNTLMLCFACVCVHACMCVCVCVCVYVVDSALLVLTWQVRVAVGNMLCRCDVFLALMNCLCCLMTGRVCGSVAAGGR